MAPAAAAVAAAIGAAAAAAAAAAVAEHSTAWMVLSNNVRNAGMIQYEWQNRLSDATAYSTAM